MIEKDTKQLEELLYKILSAGNVHRKLMGGYIDACGIRSLIEKPCRLQINNEIDRRLKALHEIAESLRLRDCRGEYISSITYLTGISKETQLAFGRRHGLEQMLEAPKAIEATERQTERLMLVAEFIALYLSFSEDAVSKQETN